jgi:hypothetical protein
MKKLIISLLVVAFATTTFAKEVKVGAPHKDSEYTYEELKDLVYSPNDILIIYSGLHDTCYKLSYLKKVLSAIKDTDNKVMIVNDQGVTKCMGATSLINANCKAMKDCEVLP